jgi:hypothetical protein
MRDIIQRLLQQKPFLPFRFSLTCGAVHEVRHPELARVKPGTLRLGRFDHSVTPPAIVDHFIISLDHIVTLWPLTADEPVVVEEPGPGERPS